MPCKRNKTYLTGHEAVDVNRYTGIPLSWRNLPGQPPDTHFAAVDQGVTPLDEVYLELSELDWWDAWRVAWTRIGGHHYLEVT